MELWLVVEEASGEQREVAVDAEQTHTVADLAQVLGASASVGLRRTGAVLDPALTLDTAGIRAGDTVVVSGRGRRRPTRPPPAPWRLVVAGGPDAGLVVPLQRGSVVIGRSPSADLRLADPGLSRNHLLIAVDRDGVTVSDQGSSNGTFMSGAPVKEPRPLEPGAIVEAGDTLLRVERAVDDVAPAAIRDGRVQFSRPPRVRPPTQPVTYELGPPPEPVTKGRIPLASSLVPLAAAPIMAISGGNMSYLAFAALSPVMAFASVWEDRRHGGKARQKQLERFHAEVAKTSAAMSAALRREAVERWVDHPDPAEALRRASGPSSRLWERRPFDADFLRVRVGWADQPSMTTWTMREGGEAAVRQGAADELEQYRVVWNVPATVDLAAGPVMGVAGPRAWVEEIARWVVAQVAVLHSPRDVTVAVAVSEKHAPAWEWTSWLPHASSAAAPFAAQPIAVGDDDGRALIGALNDLVAARKEQSQSRLSQAAALPAVLLVLDENLQVPRSAIATLLEDGPAAGIKVLWLGERAEGLPGETRTIVSMTDAVVTTTVVATGEQLTGVQPDRFSLAQATSLARSLAGVRDATARTGGGELPSFVALPELLPGGEPSAEAIKATWGRHRAGLGAPIGVTDTGPFVVDLRRDGPHALLGGTTGAGKSEMLQTFVASLAAHIPPDRLTFLLVDYKGGAAFKDCVHLPHVVGFVTDLDGHLVHRALVSLNAELHRRERLLASVGAKDLIEMERKAPKQAPAALLLLVDEFATLARELPEFVEGVVNVAQRGRSLGIHMLLATQRPAGAINDNIRANTNLRVALRMNDEADSQDVIGAKHAALLPRSLPGRAFARTGASELTEVQVGYSGGHTLAGGNERPLAVHPLRWGVVQRPQVARTVEDDSRPTDLQAVVAVVREASEQLPIPAQPPPWLPALPDILPLSDMPRPAGTAMATVGLVDVPAHQAQRPFAVDLEAEGSLLVFGTSGSGKTSLLRTIASSLAQGNSPDRLHLFALDFASRGLGVLESLPHCGAVISGDDVERVQRLFSMLDRWIAQRKQRFGEVGATTLEEFARLSRDPSALPRVVVLLDSYGGFSAVFEKIDYGARIEAFPQLISDGRPLGIHFVITGDRRNAIPLSMTSTVQAKIVLRLADLDDYAVLGLDGRIAKAASLPPGRGFQANTLEVQCALVGKDPAGDSQVEAVRQLGAELRAKWGDGSAPKVGTLPAEVHLDSLVPPPEPLRPLLGVGERELAAVAVDLEEGHFLVAGPIRSGKSTALAALGRGLREADTELQLHLLAPRRTPLTSLDIWSSVARGTGAIDDFCMELKGEIDDREPGNPPIVLVLDDGHEIADSLADSSLESIVRRGRDVDVRVVAAVETAAAQRSYGGWLPEVRKERHGLLLQPDPDMDGELLGARLPKTRASLPGRGFLVTRFGVELVQVRLS